MAERDFWAYIELLGGSAADVEPLVAALAGEKPRRIEAFAEALAQHLYALDLFALFRQPVREPEQDPADEPIPLSNDGFLYARCAVIAAGRLRYEQVLADRASFAGTWSTDGKIAAARSRPGLVPRHWARRRGVGVRNHGFVRDRREQ